MTSSHLILTSLTNSFPFEEDEFDHVHVQSIAKAVPESKVALHLMCIHSSSLSFAVGNPVRGVYYLGIAAPPHVILTCVRKSTGFSNLADLSKLLTTVSLLFVLLSPLTSSQISLFLGYRNGSPQLCAIDPCGPRDPLVLSQLIPCNLQIHLRKEHWLTTTNYWKPFTSPFLSDGSLTSDLAVRWRDCTISLILILLRLSHPPQLHQHDIPQGL